MTFFQYLEGINNTKKISKTDVWKHQILTNKPLSSFGVLEQIGYRLTSIIGVDKKIIKENVVVFAGDHGIAEMNLSKFKQSQTKKVVSLLMHGKTPLNKILGQSFDNLICVDIGINGDVLEEGLIIRKVANGTNNIYQKPAMDKKSMFAALNVGIEIAKSCFDSGTDIVALGEVGIGNTIPSSVAAALLCDLSSDIVTGNGTGVTGEVLQQKKDVIKNLILKYSNCKNDPYSILMNIGGYEICGDVGFILGCAYYKIPVILDGFITGVAALIASKMHRDVVDYLFASHLSKEPAHFYVLNELQLNPILNLGMRYGLATGSAMTLNLHKIAYKLTNNVI